MTYRDFINYLNYKDEQADEICPDGKLTDRALARRMQALVWAGCIAGLVAVITLNLGLWLIYG